MSGMIMKNRIVILQSVDGIGMISGIFSGMFSQSGRLPRIRGIF